MRLMLMAPPNRKTIEQLVLPQSLHDLLLDANFHLQPIAALVSSIFFQSRKYETEVLHDGKKGSASA